MMPCFFRLLVSSLLLLAWPLAAQEAADVERVAQGLAELMEGAEVRYAGSPGNLAMEAKVAERFAASGFAHGEIVFSAPTLLPGEATLRVDDDAIGMYPMHPSIVRPGNFREDRLDTHLVYVGRGELADLEALKGVPLEGTIALMEFDSADAWLRLQRFGFAGYLFIGSDTYSWRDAAGKIYHSEGATPRYFVGAEEGARLRQRIASTPQGRLAVSVEAEPTRWQRQELRNLWAFIPGADPDLERKVVVLTAPMDSNSIVPELAYGAQNGANLYALLELLEQFRESPPGHSVMLVALNATCQGFRGQRELAWYLRGDMGSLEQLRGQLARNIRWEQMMLEHYQRLATLEVTEEYISLLREMRTMVDDTIGRRVTVKEPIVALARRDVNLMKAELLRLRRSELPAEEVAKLEAEVNDRKEAFVSVLVLFNRVRPQKTLDDLEPREVEILRGYIAELVEEYKTRLALNEAQLALDEANARVREALGGRGVSLLIDLALNWGGDSLGLSSEVQHGWERRLGANATRIARETETQLELEPGSVFLDTMTRLGGHPETFYFGDVRAGLYEYHSSQRTAALALRTAFVPTGRSFTPADTIESLDLARVERQLRFVYAYVRNLLADAQLTASGQLDEVWMEKGSWSSYIRAAKFDEFSASVLPQLSVADSIVILTPWDPTLKTYPTLVRGDVLNASIYKTDMRAVVYARNLTKLNYALDAYQFDESYRDVLHAIDLGDVHQRYNSNLARGQDKTVALFRCKEFPVRNRFDTSLVGSSTTLVQAYVPLEARQNSTPTKFGTMGLKIVGTNKFVQWSKGPGAILASPDDEIKLLTVQKRPIINASEESPEGIGYANPERISGDFFWLASQDFAILNSHRLAKMQGVTNELAEEALALGEAHLALAAEAQGEEAHVEYLREQHIALGALASAYDHLRSINNDMLKAVVFYVALLLPFCFFVQKLCFNFVRIEKQMGMFAFLFVVTFLVFRMIHPAFRIAQAAEAIFVAFVMLALGLFVIKVLHSRFEGEMQALFRTYLGVSAEVGYSTVGQKALLIGVNNMKRRRIRTLLTTATIVLITFAMLAFSSVSKKMSPTMIPQDGAALYNGIFFVWPGGSTMDEPSATTLQELFSDTAQAAVVRRWLIGKKTDFAGAMAVANPAAGRQAQVEAVLGVPLEDEQLLHADGYPLLPGGRFFSSNRAREVLLPQRVARALGIDAEAPLEEVSITFLGQEYAVVGLLDGDKLREMRDLNQLPILPIKEVASSGWQDDSGGSTASLESAEANESSIFFVDPAELLVMPEQTAAQLGAQPYSLSIVFHQETGTWQMIDRLLRASRAKFYVSSINDFPVGADGERSMGGGVYHVGSGYKTSIGGLARLLVPLLIAGTIILNTMLGSVYERKYEIAVYNAIGLNPTHIRMFFLAEALAYSVIGSVGGYLIGQLLAMGLIHFNMVEGLNLNFSSLMVVYVILFTIAIVLLSTLYPAHAATRMAVPSGQRRWALPEHDGTTMSIVFPFIYQPRVAIGILSYLEQYFARFTEASVGELIAKLDSRESGTDAEARATYALHYNLALAPYDLGVTQEVVFQLAYDEVVQSYRLRTAVTRLSGQDTNWVTVNRPFLEKMRKYLIQWRNMDPAQHQVYVERARASFHPDEHASTPGEEVPPEADVEAGSPDGTIGTPEVKPNKDT